MVVFEYVQTAEQIIRQGSFKMFDYTKLRRLILYKYGSIQAFAEALGVSKQSVSVTLNGKTTFSQNKIVEWTKILDISPDDIGEYFFTKKVQ